MRARSLVGAALAVGVMMGSSQVASATDLSSTYSSIPDHFFSDPIDTGTQLPPAPAVAEQATITAPRDAPSGDWTYAWIMSTNLLTWTQVGLAWAPGAAEPYIFADSSTLSPDYVQGPNVPPGGSVTVRLVLEGPENIEPQPSLWVDEYRTAAGWQVLQQAKVTGELTPPTVEEYYQGNPPREPWLFRGVGFELGNAWHHMASVGLGAELADQLEVPTAG